jgi:cell division transport system permease protein
MRESNAVLPRDRGAAPLDFVIAVMAFLAALALGASLIADRATEGWSHGLAAKLTVQIVPPDSGDAKIILDRETGAAVNLLRDTPGIAHAAPLSDAELNALVAPWIGQNGLTSDIPLPRLIDASIVPGADVDVARLVMQLKRSAPHATLDDHSRWISRLSAIADTVRYSAYGILLLIAGATAAAVSFATRAGL